MAEKKSYTEFAQQWAQKVRTGENITHTYLEKPAMYRALPDLVGKAVLCVGCGTGEECQEIQSRGASRIVGIDNAEGLIEIATQSYPDIEFQVMDMEALDFPEASFDIIYASLALHYVDSWLPMLQKMHSLMKPGGEILFSIHHPLRSAMEQKKEGDTFSYTLGFSRTGNDKGEAIGDYLSKREIEDTLFNQLKVIYYHKPLSVILKNITEAGLVLQECIEPKPLEEAKAKKKNFYTVHQKIPLVMILKLTT